MPINENMVQEIVQEVMAKMQIADAPTGKHGIFKEMNDAIEAAKKSQLIVKKMSMDQREKIITCIRKKIKENAEVMARMGVEETGMGNVEGSWAELMSMLKNGQIDLLGGISYTEERSTSMLFSELPMGEDKYYLYVDTSNTDISISDLTTLNGKRIGMLPNALPAEMFHEWEKSHGVNTQQVDITGVDDVRQKIEKS